MLRLYCDLCTNFHIAIEVLDILVVQPSTPVSPIGSELRSASAMDPDSAAKCSVLRRRLPVVDSIYNLVVCSLKKVCL